MYWGEVGPDARDDQAKRGPRGYDEVNQAKAPGFFGWPYFIGNNKPYVDFNFATNVSGSKYDPAKPINDSPNNTGVRELPPAQEAMIYYPYAESEEFPLVGSGGRNAMAGPVYHSDLYKGKANRFPDYYDDKLFIYDWMRGWMMAVTFDDNGNMTSMEPFLPSIKWNNLMDVIMTPDGDFYTLEYGTGWFTANQNAILSKLKYNPGNRAPEAALEVDETAQGLPFTANFDASESVDSDGDDLTYAWDFGDGNTATGAQVSHTYETAGSYNAVLTVTDKAGESITKQVKMLAGNAPPKVNIQIEGNDNFYFPGQPIKYKVIASDDEDGTIDPDRIALSVDYLEMGHDMTSIAQGHLALSQVKTGHPGLALIGESDCVSCHKIDGTSIGPSYTKVSEKYLAQKKRRANKISYLTEKIIKGGSGVWGETAMAAHPNISPKDASVMAEYILSVTEEEKTIELPAEGEYVLEIPEGKAPGGKFVLMASYTDDGADSVEPLRAYASTVLRNANMSAVAFDAIENGSKFTVSPDMAPGLTEPMDIVILNDGAQVTYNDIDVTNMSTVVMSVSAPSMFASGGTFEIFLDDTNGDPISTGEITQSAQMGDAQNVPISLNGLSGKHTLIARYKSAKDGAPVGTLVQWTFLP